MPNEVTFKVAPERMPMIPRERMTDAQKAAADELARGPRGSVHGPYISILRSPGFMAHCQKLGAYVRFESPLDMRIREMGALMGARHYTQQFEWYVHIPHALKAGLDPSTIDAIRDGYRPPGMQTDEAVVYDFMSELLKNGGVSDPTYAQALEQFGEPGIVDLVGTVGYYVMIGMVMNVARTAIPDGKPLPLAPLPDQIVAAPRG
ncbi:MAG TPA: carboxymuconolactone decarboxylase family protein [Burkholderiales bacterium]|nr:carboxymuconolactone decarboxylase family protein [Burkholderiales bacterium]